MVDFKKVLKKEKEYKEFDDLHTQDFKVLSCIGSTEPSTFGELCNALRRIGECPATGDKMGWGCLFRQIAQLEEDGYTLVGRKGNKMEWFRLTPKGTKAVKNQDNLNLFPNAKEEPEDELEEPPWVTDNNHGKF